jgi:hypothetical protein
MLTHGGSVKHVYSQGMAPRHLVRILLIYGVGRGHALPK